MHNYGISQIHLDRYLRPLLRQQKIEQKKNGVFEENALF